MNGKPDDHPLTDILKYKKRVYGEEIDSLIVKIHQVDGRNELDKIDWFKEHDSEEFQKSLQATYNRLVESARERGWELPGGKDD